MHTKQVLQNILRSRLPVSASSTIVCREKKEKKKEDEIGFSIQTNVDKNCNVPDSKAVNSNEFQVLFTYRSKLNSVETDFKHTLLIQC